MPRAVRMSNCFVYRVGNPKLLGSGGAYTACVAVVHAANRTFAALRQRRLGAHPRTAAALANGQFFGPRTRYLCVGGRPTGVRVEFCGQMLIICSVRVAGEA